MLVSLVEYQCAANVLQVEKRYNYTTPKTFLELIKLYKSVLARKRNQVQEAIDRLDTVGQAWLSSVCVNIFKCHSISQTCFACSTGLELLLSLSPILHLCLVEQASRVRQASVLVSFCGQSSL